MTFDARERSASSGRPIELFTFSRDFQAWRFTSADRLVEVNGAQFAPRAISRSEIETSAEKARSGLTITGPRDLEVADLYRIAPPSGAVTCIVQQLHEGDTELATIWTGRIVTVEFEAAASRIVLEPTFTSLRRVGLRRMYQRQCPHVLYGPACGVNQQAFRLDATVDAVSGLTISVATAALQANGTYAGGFIEYADAVGIAERRFITDHTGVTLTLNVAPTGLSVGGALKVFPGCDHSIGAGGCGRFSNQINYGGMPYFTKKNPFGGDPIF